MDDTSPNRPFPEPSPWAVPDPAPAQGSATGTTAAGPGWAGAGQPPGGSDRQPGGGHAWGPPPPQGPHAGFLPPRTEGMAVWALVCAIVTFVIPLVPGIIALVLAAQAARAIRQGGGALTGRGLVTAARIVAVLGLLANVAFAVAVVFGGIWLSNETEGEATVKTAPLQLAAGDCVNGEEERVASVEVVDCSSPHDWEVFANVDAGTGAWPGEEALAKTAADACLAPYASYVGAAYEDSVFVMRYLTPGQAAWDQGDRVINCMLEEFADIPLEGSQRGSGL